MATVRLNPPPRGLMRGVNPFIRALLKSRVMGKRMSPIMLIEFEGRRSGRVIRIPVARHVVDGEILTLTGRQWRWNFEGGAPVTAIHRGRVLTGTAQLVSREGQAVGTAVRAMLDNGTPPFIIGISIPRKHNPTVAELDGMGGSLIRFELNELLPDGPVASATGRESSP